MALHSFNPELAEEYGTTVALVVQYIKQCQGANGCDALAYSYQEIYNHFSYISNPELKTAFDFVFIKDIVPGIMQIGGEK